MINRIHILGASGSGTTTLGEALARELGFIHLDTDEYYWEPTDPPFQKSRAIDQRLALLEVDLVQNPKWILTGSLVGWGDKLISQFDLVIFLWIPQEIRMARLEERERSKRGDAIDCGGKMHQTYLAFIEWASQYDSADESMRSKKLHEQWLKGLTCKVLKIEGLYELSDKIEMVKTLMLEDKNKSTDHLMDKMNDENHDAFLGLTE